MYVENVRKALSSLNRKEIERIAKETKKLLVGKEKIKESVKPVEVEGYLHNFINGKDTSIKYFEGFIEAIDLIYPDGAKEAFLFGSFKKKTASWRNLLMKITSGIPSKKLQQFHDNEFVIRQFQLLFVSIVERCVTEDEETTLQRLQVLNDILKSNEN